MVLFGILKTLSTIDAFIGEGETIIECLKNCIDDSVELKRIYDQIIYEAPETESEAKELAVMMAGTLKEYYDLMLFDITDPKHPKYLNDPLKNL